MPVHTYTLSMDDYWSTPEERELRRAIDEHARAAVEKHMMAVEQVIQLRIREKPRLCPQWLWLRILARVLRLEMFPMSVRMETPHA